MFNDFIEIFQTNNINCEEIIEWFNYNKDIQRQGIIYQDDTGGVVSLDTKNTTDICLSLSKIKTDEELSSLFYPMFLNLNGAFQQYIEKFNILKNIEMEINDNFNIQNYKEGQHFKEFHFESSGYRHRNRILTWAIYLNDVSNGGHTVFPYYDYTIQPIKGYILIWPAEFTHTHFGDIVEDEKYIATGWFNVVNKNQYFENKPKIQKDQLVYFNV
jgi:prolyl 4-hydroxylase